MSKLDLRRTLGPLYAASARKVTEVEVPAFSFLMVDGLGDPAHEPAYREAVEALFSVSYAAKFSVKRAVGGIDYAVMPLEGLWWADDMGAFVSGDRAAWRWTMMILQPDIVPQDVLHRSLEEVAAKKRLPGIARLRIARFEEGACAQILHVGPFADEGPTVAGLHAHIEARSSLRGKHHEIYLTDVRRADPSRWKTIIRQPMQ